MKGLLTAIPLWCALALAAFAEPFPSLYNVTGVAGDDTLNIRTAPDASSDIIGGFVSVRSGIEVVRLDPTGRWGLVNIGEQSGWASMRFLAQQPGQNDQNLPRPLNCYGTEPYWNAQIGTGQDIQFEILGEEVSLRLDETTDAASTGRSGKYATLWAGAQTGIVGVVTRAACNDGMSDRSFGFAADFVVVPHVGSGTIYSGCCSLGGN